MTTTTPATTAARDFVKGQAVTFAQAVTGHSASGYGYTHRFALGSAATVSRVSSNTITVKIVDSRYGQRGEFSYNVPRTALATPNGEAYVKPAPKPKARALGELPEGETIAIDDDRIAWIWRDAAKFAEQQRYCGQYDALTEKLGIPGREREFSVTTKVAGIDITARIKATSQKLAEALLKEKIAAAK